MLFGISEASTVRFKRLGGVVSRISRRLHDLHGLQDSSPFHETTPRLSRCTLQQSLRDANPERLPNRKKKAETCATVEVIWKRLNH